MALEDIIKGVDVAIVGNMEEIHGDKFEIIKQKAAEIEQETELSVGIFCFNVNYHQCVKYPVYHKEKLIGYEIWQNGEKIALEGI